MASPSAPGSSIGARLALAWFVFSAALLVWPLYPWLGNHIHPRVLSLPWSLTWVLLVVATNFVVLLVLHRFRVVDDVELDEHEAAPRSPEPPA